MSQHLPPVRRPARPSRALLSRLVAAADGCERSFSVTASGVEDRVLFFLEHDAGAAALLREAAQEMELPETLLKSWEAARPGADALGLALRSDGASVRLYTQYWEVLVARLRQGDPGDMPLYAGFKALPDGSTRIDRYMPVVAAPREVYMPPLREALQSLDLDPLAIEQALGPLTPERCIFTRTEGAGRNSWLTTLRRARLKPGRVTAMLAGLTQQARLAEAAACATRAPLIHVAGGEDAQKGPFTTLYFEITAAEAEAALSPMVS
ncbi:MAG: hypothetical protein GYB53_20700 [Rhodobacteraceae bacterium]|nr:hypothetical protein [Paracoccaceae bacterium]MBR9819617.1 hypothetical protein [Paracoccaceae bacterium]